MGAGANSDTNKSLNDRKQRAAGRAKQKGPEAEAVRDAQNPVPAKGKTGGAFGKGSQANAGGASPNSGDQDIEPNE